MKRYSILSVLFLMLTVFSAGAFADETAEVEMEAEKKGIEVAGAAQMTATVQAINVSEREVVFADDEGGVQVVEMGPEVKNFDQIEIGDKLVIDYYQSVALVLADPGAKIEDAGDQVVLTAAKGEKPAMITADVQDTMAEIVSIDKENRQVELKGPQGNVVTVSVPEEVGDLEKIKVGDSLHVRYTEALGISIQSPE